MKRLKNLLFKEDLDIHHFNKVKRPKVDRPRNLTLSERRDSIISEVRGERYRQDAKWGEQNHIPMLWMLILMEEVGEAAKAILDELFTSSEAYQDYRNEMIQVCAVALAALEGFDRNKWRTHERETSEETKKAGSPA